jgi:hypothetical protein
VFSTRRVGRAGRRQFPPLGSDGNLQQCRRIHFLVATPGFIAAAGIAPDYEIPVGFLTPGIIDEVAIVGSDDMNFAAAASLSRRVAPTAG